MSEMVERVARAMCERDGFEWDAADFNETANGDTPEEQREYWREKARAAIEEMLEPTDVMLMAASPSLSHRLVADAFYRAMIEAAIKDSE